jgi:hypothetical protein
MAQFENDRMVNRPIFKIALFQKLNKVKRYLKGDYRLDVDIILPNTLFTSSNLDCCKIQSG